MKSPTKFKIKIKPRKYEKNKKKHTWQVQSGAKLTF